ncbi:hypothetical protein RLV_1378 (plasmid) [Rhizobium leguminosarum bv. viciae]|nr:hypothetical protein RLV_1378 [Rhizobium leguminosarum bv. viciae]
MLGEALFERRHRGVHLTASGNKLLAILTLSFDRIDQCLEEIRSRPATAAVTISVEPSFAACWLVSRLTPGHHVLCGPGTPIGSWDRSLSVLGLRRERPVFPAEAGRLRTVPHRN